MKKRQIPHTYVIIFYIILFCATLTWIIPGGQYKESINAAGEKTVVYEAVEHAPQTWQVFSAFYKGFVDKADIIVFILIIGGAFWIVNDSKAFDIGTVSFLGRARKMENNRFLRKIGATIQHIRGCLRDERRDHCILLSTCPDGDLDGV